MQSVSAAFTAESTANTREIAENLLVSWKKITTLGSRTFTIGVSTIGGTDIIGVNTGSIGTPGVYQYFDETDYVQGLGWERSLNMPIGGISKALAEARLDNTSRRFTPRYMGGSGELFTAVLPRRPVIISAGFNLAGIDQTIPQFSGVISRQPEVNARTGQLRMQMADYIDFFENRRMDETTMFTGVTSDEIIEYILSNKLGLTTADYDLDTGINPIPFIIAPVETKFSDLINDIVQAEMGYFYQDEEGKYKFENRQHWTRSPFNTVVDTITTADVIEAETIDEDHIINVVEVKANPREKQALATIYTQSGTIELLPGDNEVFINFDNPVLAANSPVYVANSAEDGSGSNVTGQVNIKSTDLFAQAVKYVFTNSSGGTAYITSLTIDGREATERYPDTGIYYRAQDDSSVTAFEERILSINNDYIQSQTWAQSFASLVLSQFSDPESLQTIVIRAKPYLQLGDLISWQGSSWRIFDIKATLDPSAGFIQELKLLQREVQTYFRIGISIIGGDDQIAP